MAPTVLPVRETLPALTPAPRSDIPVSLARSARRFSSFDVTGEAIQEAFDHCLKNLVSGRWDASELIDEITRLRDTSGIPLAHEVLMVLYYNAVGQPYVIAGLRDFIFSAAEGTLPLPPDVRIAGLPPDSIVKIADGSANLSRDLSSAWPGAERKIIEGSALAGTRETEAERQFETHAASLPDDLAHPTSETFFRTYPLPSTDFANTAAARSAQRERLRTEISRTPSHAVERARQAYLAPLIELAEEFDLMILDSGNLYHEGKLVLPAGVSAQGTLYGFSSDGRNVAIARGGKPDVGTPAKRKGPATPLETADSLGGLLDLPETYLSDLAYAPPPANGHAKGRWHPRSVEIDMEALGEHELVKARNVVFAMHAYAVKIGASELRIAIPDPDDEENGRLAKSGYYCPTKEDLPELVEAVRQTLPLSLLPKKLKLDFLPLKLKATQAVTTEGAEVLFSSLKTRAFKDWLARTVLTALQHESVHVLHDGHAGIVSLVRRAMALDGWTMVYGDSSGDEYLAVLAENFFDHPQNRHRFPNGYRLFYTLLKMRESGVSWSGKKSAAELDALVAGGKPFETSTALRTFLSASRAKAPAAEPTLPPRGVFANWEKGTLSVPNSPGRRPKFQVSREHPAANPLLSDPEDFDPMSGEGDSPHAPVQMPPKNAAATGSPVTSTMPLPPTRTLTLPFVALKLWR